MITICEGWLGVVHPEPVILKTQNGPGVSYGMCPECSRRMEAEVNLATMKFDPAYQAYLEGVTDPRD